ncbi:hypothetical protein DFAR_2870036 [Desulfarculales bacterium]
MLRWIREALSVRAVQWRITHFLRHALKCIAPDTKTLPTVPKAFMTLEEHAHLVNPRSLAPTIPTPAWRGLAASSRPPG